MHDDHFAAITQVLQQDKTRRRAVQRLAFAPLLSAMTALLTDLTAVAAGHPHQRAQDRQDRQRRHARRRRHQRRDARRRDNDAGLGECQEEFGGGQACTENCRCVDKYRCGAPRPAAERTACRQDATAPLVCCYGLAYDCATSCDCCGGLSCQNHECVTTT